MCRRSRPGIEPLLKRRCYEYETTYVSSDVRKRALQSFYALSLDNCASTGAMMAALEGLLRITQCVLRESLAIPAKERAQLNFACSLDVDEVPQCTARAEPDVPGISAISFGITN